MSGTTMLVALLLCAPPPLEDSLARELGLELSGIAKLAAPAPTVVADVTRITGMPVDALRAASSHRARAKDPRSGKTVAAVIVRVPVTDVPGVTHVTVAISEATVLAAGVAADASAREAWSTFLGQFRGRQAPTRARSAPLRRLLARRADAELGRTADARELRALLRLRSIMLASAAHVMTVMTRKGEKSVPVETVAEMQRGARELLELEPQLGFLGNGRDVFREAAGAATSYAGNLPTAAGEDTPERRQILRKASIASCMRCHMMEGHELDGPLMEAVARRRTELGAGNGFFVILHDVIPRPDDVESSQVLATASRAALLLAAPE